MNVIKQINYNMFLNLPAYVACAASQRILYVMGRGAGTNSQKLSIENYNPHTDVWSVIKYSSSSIIPTTIQLVMVNNQLIRIGRERAGNEYVSEIYDEELDIWSANYETLLKAKPCPLCSVYFCVVKYS